jgi:dUTP pyrophosphatase
MLNVKVINISENQLPKYESVRAAGLDLRANIKDRIRLDPLERKLIPTGLKIAIPDGYEAQVRPRSGLALKHGISVLNTPGTIDADYRAEIGVVLINLSGVPFEVNPGDRIAQLVFKKVEHIEWEEVDELPSTERGEGGFGHSGIK